MSGVTALGSSVTPLSSLQDVGYNNTAISQGAGSSQTAPYATGDLSNVDAISTDFEAVFLSQMMGAMFSGDEVTAYFGSGTAGEIYKSFLMDQYGKAFAHAGGIGIASEIKKELLALQEVS